MRCMPTFFCRMYPIIVEFIGPLYVAILQNAVTNISIHMILALVTLHSCVYEIVSDGRSVLSVLELFVVSYLITVCAILIDSTWLRPLIIANIVKFTFCIFLMMHSGIGGSQHNSSEGLQRKILCTANDAFDQHGMHLNGGPLKQTCAFIGKNAQFSDLIMRPYYVVFHPSWVILMAEFLLISAIVIHGFMCSFEVHRVYQSISRSEVANLRKAVQSVGTLMSPLPPSLSTESSTSRSENKFVIKPLSETTKSVTANNSSKTPDSGNVIENTDSAIGTLPQQKQRTLDAVDDFVSRVMIDIMNMASNQDFDDDNTDEESDDQRNTNGQSESSGSTDDEGSESENCGCDNDNDNDSDDETNSEEEVYPETVFYRTYDFPTTNPLNEDTDSTTTTSSGESETDESKLLPSDPKDAHHSNSSVADEIRDTMSQSSSTPSAEVQYVKYTVQQLPAFQTSPNLAKSCVTPLSVSPDATTTHPWTYTVNIPLYDRDAIRMPLEYVTSCGMKISFGEFKPCGNASTPQPESLFANTCLSYEEMVSQLFHEQTVGPTVGPSQNNLASNATEETGREQFDEMPNGN